MAVKLMAVVPHGSIVIQDLHYNIDAHKTINGFQKIKNQFLEKNIEYIVVIDPHDKIISKKFLFFIANKYKGKWSNKNFNIEKSFDSNPVINSKIKNLDYDNIIITEEHSHKMSWGSFIPLYSLDLNKQITVLSISNQIETQELKNTGWNLFKFFNQFKENICILFSCDLSHTHSKENSNFGFSPYAETYDNYVKFLLSSNNVDKYNNIDYNIVQQARTDANAQLTMLSSICSKVRYRSIVYSYEVPTYFGMLTSSIELI